MGVVITSASAEIYGEADLGSGRARGHVPVAPASSAISMFTVVIATLGGEHRRQRRLARERLRERRAEAHHLQDRRPHHRHRRHR